LIPSFRDPSLELEPYHTACSGNDFEALHEQLRPELQHTLHQRNYGSGDEASGVAGLHHRVNTTNAVALAPGSNVAPSAPSLRGDRTPAKGITLDMLMQRESWSYKNVVLVDMISLLVGSVVCILSTVMSLKAIFEKIVMGQSC
jgi:hypothetical protein